MKRYSIQEADEIIAKLKQYSLDELHALFHEGGIPSFQEFEGETRGSFLARNRQNSWLHRLSIKLIFDSFFARWTGKKFLTSFRGEKRRRGINLYNNLILRHPLSLRHVH